MLLCGSGRARPAQRSGMLARMRITSKGAKIAVDIEPPEPVQVLLIHGGPGAPADFGLMRTWLDAWRVGNARYDQRGVHRSSCDDGRWGLAAHVDDLEAVRSAAAKGKVIVVGHSFGGLIALAWAQAFPSQVRGLLLSSPALTVGPDFRASMREVVAAVRRGLTKQQWRRLGWANARTLLPLPYCDRAMAEVYGLVMQAYTGAPPPAWVAHCSARATRKTRRAIMREDPQQYDFSSLPGDFPVRIAVGDRDIHGPGYLDQAAGVARADTTVLRECGHVLWHDQPAAFRRWLAEGLDVCGLERRQASSLSR